MSDLYPNIRDVKADRTAVLGGDRRTEHPVGHEDVRHSRLFEREALGVRPVVGLERECGRCRTHARVVEQIGQPHPLPVHRWDPPTGHALEVADKGRARQGLELGERVGVRPIDEAAHLEPV